MIKICIFNHTFQKPEFYKRWRLLAEKYSDIDVTLLAPADWTWGESKGLTYGMVEYLKGCAVEEERFHIHLIDVRHTRRIGWVSERMEQEIAELRPDIFYYIGAHYDLSFMKIFEFKKKYHLDNMKIMLFSMRGQKLSLRFEKSKHPVQLAKNIVKYAIFKSRLNRLNKNTDAVFCHYPVGRDEFIREGYHGPIYMQTQVGVDTEVFRPNPESRQKIREKYNIGDAYLFGSASRFTSDKGLSEVIAALPKEGNWKYLMMGWGRDDEVEKIKTEIAERGLEDKIILTGYIHTWAEMAEHWNALDCAVHMPLTTPLWEETFSLSLVQAMATALPVIGSSSGSVPYQIGPEGIIVPERDIEALNAQFETMLANPAYGVEIGKKMFKRATRCFCTRHLNDCFYDTIQDILVGVHDENKVDMTKYLVEE